MQSVLFVAPRVFLRKISFMTKKGVVFHFKETYRFSFFLSLSIHYSFSSSKKYQFAFSFSPHPSFLVCQLLPLVITASSSIPERSADVSFLSLKLRIFTSNLRDIHILSRHATDIFTHFLAKLRTFKFLLAKLRTLTLFFAKLYDINTLPH
ncbi:unnamed protein product [Acanthosepion pharaonis]|uniref:Uncharacterized protein n=1 Tax=Acanthosepion pharaonis TaxID=158019 RepID=A0A812AKZ8_ACAPH|nr:unnamed protein product [Sepia pharaonis]